MHMSSFKRLFKQYVFNKKTLEKTENAMKNKQSRDRQHWAQDTERRQQDRKLTR